MNGPVRSPLAATPLVACMTFAAFWAFGSIIQLGSWLVRPALALAIVTVVIIGVRLISRSRSLPTLAGAATTFLVLIPQYARSESGERFYLPTPSAVSALFRGFSDGATYAEATEHPAAVTPGYESLLALGLLVLFVAAEHVAVSWRATATAGLILLAPWAPAVALQRSVPAAIVFAALAAWILALAATKAPSPGEARAPVGKSVVATAAVLALVALVAPTAIGGSGWGKISERYAPDLFDGRNTRLNLELDLRTSLTLNSETPVFAYVSSAGRSDAFRVYTFTDFDGANWNYTSTPVEGLSPSDGVLWPTPVDDWNSSATAQITVAMLSLTASNLPVPVAPRMVNAAGTWSYDPATDQVIGVDSTTHDLTYSMLVDFAFQNADALRGADAAAALDQAPDLTDPAYLAIPPAVDLPRILSLTRELTADVTTRYDQALAIQSYLRDPTVFTYDTGFSDASGDAVSAFLDQRRGYCLQFASAMVVMLRSIGIPSRLSEGFLPGEAESDGTFVVRGADAHAWPEVYFPGRGWVRFEPTPEIQTGAPPAWADPDPDRASLPGDATDGSVPAVPSGGAATGGVPTAPGVAAAGSGNGRLVITLVLAAALALACIGGWLFWRRREGGVHGTGHGPEGAWLRLNHRLRDNGWPASATPLEATAHVLRALRETTGTPVRPEPEAALRALGTAVSDHRYSPTPTDVPQAQLNAWVDEVVGEAEAATAEAARGRPARGDAQSAPRVES